MPTAAKTVAVSTEAGLNAALLDAATTADQGLIEIDIAGKIVEDSDPTAINLAAGNTLLIKGVADANGVTGTLDGAGAHRGLFAYQGQVTIQDLTIQNTLARGGAGGSDVEGGGGGGAGLGGGLYVAGTSAGAGSGGQVTLSNVSFNGNRAIGGRGGDADGRNPDQGGGGGGGLGGDAGVRSGGGIGGGASGGPASGAGMSGIVPGAAGGGGSGAEADITTYGSLIDGAAGGPNGGGGGGGGSGVELYGGGGGGGIGGGSGTTGAYRLGNGIGGAGGYGGGGGAAAARGHVGNGGGGGFGGGGGASRIAGGNGGFGGGGGSNSSAVWDPPGIGGFGGGNAAVGGGGGGLGAGGDVFVQQGGSLVILGGTLSGGGVASGHGGSLYSADGTTSNQGADGQAYGAGVFFQGDNALTLAAGAGGTTTTIADDIADQAGVAGSGGSVSLAVGGTGLPSGTVVLGGTDSYSGATTIAAGSTLQIGLGGATGSLDKTSGIANGGTLAIDRGGSLAIAAPISGAGGLTLDGGATVALSGANSYSGGTRLLNGTLSLGASGDLGTGPLAMAAGTALSFSQTDLTISSALSLAGDPTFDIAASQTETLSGVISDTPGAVPGVVEKSGGGTLVLSGANLYSGGTLLLSGTLRLDTAGAAGSGVITFGFGPGAPTLELAHAPSNGTPFANTLAGFGPGDRLELDDVAPEAGATATVSGSTLAVTSGTSSQTFTLAAPTQAVFAVTSDNAQGIYVTAYARPTIIGTVAGQTSRNGAALAPFANVDLSDANPGAIDTLTIALSGGSGTLSGSGLVGRSDGTYTLTGDPDTISDRLQKLSFQPGNLALGASATTTFTLTDQSSAAPVAVATDATTTVLASRDVPPPADTSGPTPSPVPPAPPVTTVPAAGPTPSPVATPEPAAPTIPMNVAPTPAAGPAPATSPLAGTTARVDDISGEPYTAVETSYDDAGRVAAQTFYGPRGRVYQQSSTDYADDGSAATTTSSGVYFAQRPFFAFVDRLAPDGTETEQDVFYKDGHQTVQALVQGATLASIADDTFYTQPGGDNTFAFTPGFGHDTITSFVLGSPDHDTILLPADAAGHLGGILHRATADADGDAVLHLAGGDSITVEGVSVAQLRHHPNVFGFAAG